jgi:molecular chaperone DnaK
VPQVEVTFDIDANGILNVSAKDKSSGKEQTVTIAESANLDESDVNRMIREAEEHASEDAVRRQEIDARNELDSLAYRVDQLLSDLQDRLPVNEKARAEQLVADARQAVGEQAGLDRVRPMVADLEQLVHALPAAAAQAPGPGQPAEGAAAGADGGAASEAADDEEVVDAEFTRE